LVNFALTLLLAVLPLAVAGHNGAAFIAGIVLFIHAWRNGRLSFIVSNASNRTHLILFALYCFTFMLSTWLNPNNPENPLVASGGFWAIWLLPALINTAIEGNEGALRTFFDRAMKWLPYLALTWGLVALSQMLFSWRLSGLTIESTFPRAQAFYSHPLTLAYVGLVLFPFSTLLFFRHPKKLSAVALFVGIALLIVASKSRSAQAVAFLVILWNVWTMLRGGTRVTIVGLLFTTLIGVLATKNPISSRFHQMIESPDASENLIDDRIVFWEVHWEMFKDKPILGHGENLGTKYRTPYYNEFGYQEFNRKYEAHNLLLQILVNTGLVGFSLFSIWLGWVSWVLYRSRDFDLGKASLQSVFALLLGGLTQNAFQDSEVRYSFILVIVCAVILSETLNKNRLSKVVR